MLVAIFINVKIMWIGSDNGLHQRNASIEDNTCPKKMVNWNTILLQNEHLIFIVCF